MLWGISFQNLQMLMATIPTYDTDEDQEEKEPETLDEIGEFFNSIA